MAAQPPPSREPEWLLRAWVATRREVRRYFVTAWAFATSPRKTSFAWAEGEFDALNPLAYLLNSLAIVGPWRALWQRILGTPDLPLWQDIMSAVGPFLGVVVLGSIFHGLYALVARSGRRLASTWAISIYTTGGIPTVFHLVATPFALITSTCKTPEQFREHVVAVAIASVLPYPILIWQALGLAGLHRTRRRTGAIIQIMGLFVFALAATAVAFGMLMLFRLVRH